MKSEFSRQIIHLSAIVFIFLSVYATSKLVSIYCFVIAAGLMVYAIYFQMEKRRILKFIERMERPLRKALMHLEDRPMDTPPFSGAFWFFFAIGLTFAIFPLPIARAAVWILAMGDSASTLFGRAIGKRKIAHNKTLEGTIAFFVTAITVVMFVPIEIAFIGAVVGTIAELLPSTLLLRKLKEKGIVNDNLLVPLLSGFVMYLLII